MFDGSIRVPATDAGCDGSHLRYYPWRNIRSPPRPPDAGQRSLVQSRAQTNKSLTNPKLFVSLTVYASDYIPVLQP
jgi:hypothetical protein